MQLHRRRFLRALAAVGVSSALWLPNMHRLLAADLEGLGEADAPLPPLARRLLTRHLALWEGMSQADIVRMRETNAEWDFMGRTFLVLALVNVSLRQPETTTRHLAVIDRILDDTLEAEAVLGQEHFLMPYAWGKPWVAQPRRSLFVDGEIALMIGARRLLEPRAELEAVHHARLDHIAERMQAGPVWSAESYPDECWTFCNTAALAAVRLADAVDGTRRGVLADEWLAIARQRLIDERSGMLVSSFDYQGRHMDGPEGSSIWFSAHNLMLVDEDFAREQYQLARDTLGRRLLGFGYCREWPATWTGPADIDSGPIVPFLEASAGSSGLALVAAGAFGDRDFLGALTASLDLAAFPVERDGGVAFQASNQVGDAVLLYALVQGPLWQRINAGRTT